MLILRGHKDAVRCLSYSPDGRHLASGSEDGTVRLWDLANGGISVAVLKHGSSVEALTFSPEDSTLITGNAEGELSKWAASLNRQNVEERVGSASRQHKVTAIPPPVLVSRIRAHNGGIRCVSFSPDSLALLTAGWNQTVTAWLAAPMEELAVVQQDLACTALAIALDNKLLAAGNEDGTIRFYDCETAELQNIVEHQIPLFALAWSPDGRLLASGHADGTILLREGNKTHATMSGHTWTIYTLAFTPDGRTLVSGSADGTVRVWDVATGREKRCFRWHKSWVTCAAVAPDGMTAAAGSADRTIVVWDLDED